MMIAWNYANSREMALSLFHPQKPLQRCPPTVQQGFDRAVLFTHLDCDLLGCVTLNK